MVKSSSENSKSSEQLYPILQEYYVPYPAEDQIENTIESLRQYVPATRKSVFVRYQNLTKLVKDAAISINFMGISYWVVTLLLYAMGYVALVSLPGDAYQLIFVLAPIPVILGLLQVFRGREENVTELELACKITPQEIVISKILVICAYNAILNLALSTILSFQSPFIILWKMTLLWLMPMIFTGSIALWFCSKVKGSYSMLLSLIFWVLSSFVLVSQEQLFEKVINLNPWLLAAFICIGIGVFAAQIVKIKNRYFFERSVSTWN
jgi:hypothetical protein